MRFFFSSKTVETDLSALDCDMHSHLLPGIDDGAPDPAASISLVSGLQSLGLQRFITTPHVIRDLYPNNDASIEAAQESLVAAGGPRLKAAAEYMMDDHFSRLLHEKAALRCISGNYVLVEFSFVAMPFDWKEIFFNLQVQGYQPILAHPERYTYLAAQKQVFAEIISLGVLLQLNLNSLTGYYGKQPAELAAHLVKQKLISFLGTDCHHQRHIDALRNGKHLMPALNQLLDSGKILNPTLASA